MESQLLRDYSLFGMRIRSRLELPELLPAQGEGEPDVEIEIGEIPSIEEADSVTPVEGRLLFNVPEVARYLIERGCTIRVAPEPGAPQRNIRLYLLGSAFGALLHQRGFLPLHANAVEIEGRAFAFMGASGAGKSTLAAWFHDNGFHVIADDVCAVCIDEDGGAVAHPGLPRLRLWSDAIRFMGRYPGNYQRSYVGPGEELEEKFDVPIDAQKRIGAELPLAAIYLLERGEQFRVEQVQGLAAAETIFENTYRGYFLQAAGERKSHWHLAVRLVQTTCVFRVVREWSLPKLADQSAALVAHANGLA